MDFKLEHDENHPFPWSITSSRGIEATVEDESTAQFILDCFNEHQLVDTSAASAVATWREVFEWVLGLAGKAFANGNDEQAHLLRRLANDAMDRGNAEQKKRDEYYVKYLHAGATHRSFDGKEPRRVFDRKES